MLFRFVRSAPRKYYERHERHERLTSLTSSLHLCETLHERTQRQLRQARAQCSSGGGRLLKLTGIDYQAVRAARDLLSVQAKARLSMSLALLINTVNEAAAPLAWFKITECGAF